MTITIYHYLMLGLVLFLIGFAGSVTSKYVIQVLISIEFMLCGVNINFVSFSTFCDNLTFNGAIFALFYCVIGALEFAIAIYIFYLMYQKKYSDKIDDYGDI